MDFPLISVIIPVYNKQKYLGRCLDSLVSQTYENLEIIIVDDGSTDKSADLIQEYAERYKNIYYYYQVNQGAAAARNLGIEKARGSYICFVDSDDIIFNEYVSYLYKLLEVSGADCSVCSAYKLCEGETYVEKKEEDNWFLYKRQEALGNFFYRKGITPYPCLKLIRSDLIDKDDFPKGIKYGEDAAFVYHILKKCKAVVYSPRILYLYFQNPGSVTHQADWKGYAYSWGFLKKEIFEEAEKEFPSIRKSIMSKEFVLASDFYCRVYTLNEAKEFKQDLKEYIRKNRLTVFRDSECKLSNRILAGIACLNIDGMAILCRLILRLNDKFHFIRRSF